MKLRHLTRTLSLCALLFLLGPAAGKLSAQQIEPPTKTTSTKLPTCAPPERGIWWVFEDCVMTGGSTGRRTAPSHVRVLPEVSLHLAPGATLDIDFAQFNLRIGDGSRVIIAEGASIR